jgi:6-phosphogluconate dehydrogenase
LLPFLQDLAERDAAWRRVVALAVTNGVPAPGMMASLSYFDTYRRERLPANMVQVRCG